MTFYQRIALALAIIVGILCAAALSQGCGASEGRHATVEYLGETYAGFHCFAFLDKNTGTYFGGSCVGK
jgi:hypothetical protein